jgi:uncharacterized Zn finger protein
MNCKGVVPRRAARRFTSSSLSVGPDLAAAIGAGRAIDAGPDALCGFPYLPVDLVLIELALEFHELAKSPVLVFLLLGKRTNLNQIDRHENSRNFYANRCNLYFGCVFLECPCARTCRKFLARSSMGWGGWDYRPYAPVAQRRAKALREVKRLAAKGKPVSPVEITGRVIASTFWGKSWCDNLESYSDFANRLPRGRTYARNGSVVDLQIEPGKISSMVSGSHLYRITIRIRPLNEQLWKKLKEQCGVGIGSAVELLQGRLSTSVMSVVTSRECGLFPSPAEIEMSCSCPDWAGMCKHVAATLYGVGHRLDHQPELLFTLRRVDHLELIAQAGSSAPKRKTGGRRTIATDQLADVFGIELDSQEIPSIGLPTSAAKSASQGKTATPQKEKTVRRNSANTRERTPASSGHQAGSSVKPLTAAARKRIAEAQRKRWRDMREKMLLQHDNGDSPSAAPSNPTKKAKLAPSARAKSERRVRSM